MCCNVQVDGVWAVDGGLETAEGHEAAPLRGRVEGGVWTIQNISRVQIVSRNCPPPPSKKKKKKIHRRRKERKGGEKKREKIKKQHTHSSLKIVLEIVTVEMESYALLISHENEEVKKCIYCYRGVTIMFPLPPGSERTMHYSVRWAGRGDWKDNALFSQVSWKRWLKEQCIIQSGEPEEVIERTMHYSVGWAGRGDWKDNALFSQVSQKRWLKEQCMIQSGEPEEVIERTMHYSVRWARGGDWKNNAWFS